MPPSEPLDLLVVGSGVAGLTAAVRAAEQHRLRVGVLTKCELADSTTRWAQGGVAAVLRGDPDSTDLHLSDTLAAGAGLCDTEAVRVLVDDGPDRVRDLVELGASFDTDPAGQLELAREGGHSLPRIVHAGGAATGAEVERTLVDAVRDRAVAVHERYFATDLLVEHGVCRGVRALDPSGVAVEVRARHTLLATGGAGQLFSVTTNPVEVTGDGIAMALRAGVAVADVEFVQFHPTALHHPAMPRPLLSEALRGHGALLRDTDGDRFVDELQPRDIVSRAMMRRMVDQGVDHLWLDLRGIDRFADRFPTIAADLAAAGVDPVGDLVPVAPAAHYLCGGVVTDLDGATALPGLWAAGEVACSGVHGANRLASNSLLEGMVFAHRALTAIIGGRDGPARTGAMRAVLGVAGDPDDFRVIGGRPLVGWSAPTPIDRRPPVSPAADPGALLIGLQRAMTLGAGVLRDAASLAAAGAALDAVASSAGAPSGPAALEVANLLEVGRAVVAAATARTESRGAHTRRDWPDPSPGLRCRLVLSG